LNLSTLHTDILIAGGGMTGVCCSLAAARLGARVILCQDRHVLGGNASSEIRMHIVGATGLSGGTALETELREGGLMEEIRLDLAVHNPQRAPALLDLLLYDKCRQEPNLTLLLNTTVVSADVKNDLIHSVRAERPSTEEAFTLHAKTFIDCTGDGRLGLEAGVPFTHGRESQAAHGETLAQPVSDPHTLGSTLLLQARKHPRPMPFTPPPWVRRFDQEHFALRPYGQPGSDLGLEYGYWWVEWGGCLDTLRDNERIRDELLAITLGVWDFIKNRSALDASHWALDWIGFLPGKRESRRFIGQHVLTESDLLRSRAFPDTIAYGGWPIDTHPPEGIDAPHLPPCHQHPLPHLYDIPLRACLATTPRNLMFAGRNLSATHIAFASTRVMATCAAIGQGVGTAASMAIRENRLPADLPSHPDLLHRIQQQLLKDDAYLIGHHNQDPLDLVRTATSLTASSSQRGAGPDQVRSGQTRSVHGPPQPSAPISGSLWDQVLASADGHASITHAPCAPPDRAHPGPHRWMSDPAQPLPAWLEIRWDQPVTLRHLILIFDTGLHRLLTLSQADGYTQKMLWGQPQLETVRDYTLELETPSGWSTLAAITDNYQRRRSHHFHSAPPSCALRINITATHGLDHARLLEVRAYA
jgi:hypothetical protein